jgi:putative transposase
MFVQTLYSYRSKGEYLLHSFVLMPDHFHVLLTPAPDKTLERVVQLVKGGSARCLGLHLHLRFPVWQRGFSDHRIRDARDLDAHVCYIEQNPVRKRLVSSAQEYRWSSASGGFQMDDVPQGLKPVTLVATAPGTAKAVP